MSNSPQPNELGLAELRLALSIAEGPSLKVGGTKLLGLGSGPFKRLRNLGLLVLKKRATTLVCQECHRWHRATVIFDHERQAMTYFCSEAGRVTVEPAALEDHELQLDRLLEWIAGTLHIPEAQRPICFVQDRFWELGQANIHHCLLRVMLARRIDSLAGLARIETIARRRTGKTGVILTTSSSFAEPHRMTNGFSVISLTEILVADESKARINLDRLLMIAEPEATIDPYSSGGPGPRSGSHFIKAEHQRRVSKGEALVKIGEESRELERWYAKNHRDGPRLTADTIANIIRTEHNRSRVSDFSTN